MQLSIINVTSSCSGHIVQEISFLSLSFLSHKLVVCYDVMGLLHYHSALVVAFMNVADAEALWNVAMLALIFVILFVL